MCKVTLDKTANGHLYEDLKGIRGMEYPHKACMDRTHELSDAKYRQESFKICKRFKNFEQEEEDTSAFM